MNGCAVTKQVGADMSRMTAARVKMATKPTDDFIDPKSSQWLARSWGEDGSISLFRLLLLLNQPFQLLGGFIPKRAGSPFIALPMKLDARRWTKIQVSEAKIRNFLDPCPSIVEEQEERTI